MHINYYALAGKEQKAPVNKNLRTVDQGPRQTGGPRYFGWGGAGEATERQRGSNLVKFRCIAAPVKVVDLHGW